MSTSDRQELRRAIEADIRKHNLLLSPAWTHEWVKSLLASLDRLGFCVIPTGDATLDPEKASEAELAEFRARWTPAVFMNEDGEPEARWRVGNEIVNVCPTRPMQSYVFDRAAERVVAEMRQVDLAPGGPR